MNNNKHAMAKFSALPSNI